MHLKDVQGLLVCVIPVVTYDFCVQCVHMRSTVTNISMKQEREVVRALFESCFSIGEQAFLTTFVKRCEKRKFLVNALM